MSTWNAFWKSETLLVLADGLHTHFSLTLCLIVWI